ncbi:unnamed protein product [Pylaiella littoralis]
MQSLVLVDGPYDRLYGNGGGGPAKGDRTLLPLGLIPKPLAGGSTTAAAAAAAAAADPSQQGRQKKQSTARGGGGECPSALPSPPEGPPIMVLFPATLHLAIFLAPPPRATIVSAIMSLLAMLGSWGWGWGLLSTAGVASGLAAGFAAGLGVRSRPVGGWSYAALSVLGIALLGGGKASIAFGVSLALSTLWRSGWWLYLQPECAPVLFMLSGTTADVALGFLLASLLQIHGTPLKQQQESSSHLVAQPQRPDNAAHQAPVSVSEPQGASMWDAVTPPGIAGGARGSRW